MYVFSGQQFLRGILMALTPMMQQYFAIKEEYPDCIIFFRLGDFYEMFFEDAETAASELELVLTGRDCGLSEKAPMCGVPYHSASGYIGRMVEKGYSIAICEQMEDPSMAKGIVKREIVRIITPGTQNDETFLKEDENSYLMAVLKEDSAVSVAVTDVTTGEFYTSTFSYDPEMLKGETAKYSPREFLVFKEDEISQFLRKETGVPVTLKENIIPSDEDLILNHEFTEVEGDIPYTGKKVSLGLVSYLKATQKNSLPDLSVLKSYEVSDTMVLDAGTRRNLELTENIMDRGRRGTLISVIDRTSTAMGARNLRRWIEKPLIKQSEIEKRLDAVDILFKNVTLCENLREALKKVYDIERLAGKITSGSVSPRELLSLKNSLRMIPEVRKLLGEVTYGELERTYTELDTLSDVADLIENSIDENAPVSLKEGGIIRPGCSSEADELREIMKNGRSYIASLEEKERKETGISSLKIGYNRVFGYYIEITRANFSKIPEGRYIRKQTLANAERYITEDLKVMEEKITGAEEKLSALEYSLFSEVRERVSVESGRIRKTASLISDLDCYVGFAATALELNFTRPSFTDSGRTEIKGGRHPVVETMIPRGEFVRNDTHLDYEDSNFLIITGPNMSGKSTYMRQVALIVLMAQLGSFVPADRAEITVTDRIFTRIGASDDLSGGKSTFMVEMHEVSNILKNATRQSLILLDEVGRGTSTYDGLSIAWAVTEYIMGDKGIKARTLFATHYHELIELEDEIKGIKNYSVAVKELKGEVIFLRKIVEGGADESYGIEVARLAGLPREVIKRAGEILKTLEKKEPREKFSIREELRQLSFMDYMNVSEEPSSDIEEEIKNLDTDNMTPMDALNEIIRLKDKINNRK